MSSKNHLSFQISAANTQLVGLGTAAFGTSIPKAQAFDVLDAFVAMGGKIIDTANNYAFWDGVGGESETTLGEWLAEQDRTQIEIHTKLGAQPLSNEDDADMEGLSKQSINMAIERSLKRLSTKYIDVLYAHVDDLNTPLLETWTALSALVDKGIVGKLGISNYRADRVHQLNEIIKQHKLAPISYAQYRHSVLSPKAEADFGVQVCLDDAVRAALSEGDVTPKIVAYSPLLDGAFEQTQDLPENYQTEANSALRTSLQAEASKQQVSASALALKQLADEGILTLTMTGKLPRLYSNLALFQS